MDAQVLVIGGSGMLGRAIGERLAARGSAFIAPPRAELDLLAPNTLQRWLPGIRTVINCSAWTDVDGAEANPDAADALNGHAVGTLARACRAAGAVLVHYGTDYVFSGQATQPYPLNAPIAPINAYGRSKALGEAQIAEEVTRGLSALVLRTSWLYAPWGKNFVRTIADAARKRPELKVVNDQHGRPTSAEHLADCTLRLLDAGARGTLHATDGGQTSWFGFAQRIAAKVNPACVVHPCSSAEFPRPARRPSYSVLDLAPIERLIGPMPPWEHNLDAVLARL
jgi:dTDP-4-dehydrorhamnose reductase